MSKDVLDFLTEHRPFYLATVNGKDPKVRPMGFVMEQNGKIYFGVGTQKECYRQMVDSPLVQIACTGKDHAWLRLTGKAVFDDDPALFQAAVALMPMLKEAYPEGGPKLGTFYLKEGTAQFYDMKGAVTKTVNL